MVRYDRTIPPGGEGEITLQVDTRGYQRKITKSARVTSSDPGRRTSKIYLSMNVRTYIIVEPGTKIMLRGFIGDEIRRVLRIRSVDDHPLEITGTNTNLASVIDYKLTPAGKDHRYSLEVTSKAIERRSASGFLTLDTNHPKKKTVKLSVHVRIRPEIEYWPPRITFRERAGSGSKGRPSKKILTVVNNRGKSFHIRELHYNKDYFDVRSLAESENPAVKYRLQVIPLVDQLPGGRTEVQDTLTIKTDSPKAGEIKIPITITVKQ